MSSSSTAVLGTSPDDYLGKNAFDFIHQEDAEKALQSLSQITTERRVAVDPFRFLNKNGEWRWLETVLTNMLDNPSVNGIVANSIDVTEKKKEEQHLNLLESVVTHTNDSVLITEAEPIDRPGPRIVYVNEAFTKMTGYSAEEVLGKSPRILQGPKTDKSELAKLKQAMKNWESSEITVINYKKNGEEFWINFSLSPVADEQGWFTHWIAIERDVTKVKNEQIRNELLSQISSAFNEGVDTSASLDRLCRLLVGFGEFSFCEIWMPTISRGSLRLYSHFENDEAARLFYDYSKGVRDVKFGEGLAGNVWQKGQAVAWGESDQNKYSLRKEAAQKSGIKTVMGFPLKHRNQVTGVLVLGTKEDKMTVQSYLPILTELETFIGSEISRKRLESDLSYLFNALPDLICLADFEGTFLQINKSGCELLGYSEEEILGANFDQFVPPNDRNVSARQNLSLTDGKTTFQFESRCVKKSGEIVWLSWSCNSHVADGVIYATAKDITLKKETDLKILRANERFEKVTQATTDAIWDWDIENDNFYRGDGFEKLFGYEAKRSLKRKEFWQDSFHPDDLPVIQSGLKECIEDPSASFWSQQYRIIQKAGEIKTVIDKGVIIRNEEGVAIRMVGAITDISDRMKYEEELHELNRILQEHIKELKISNEQLEQFAFVASHDLQEPLRMISSFMSQLERKYGDRLDDKAHQYIHFAKDGAKRMKQIILDLLEYSRAGKINENLESIDVNDLLEDFKLLRKRAIEINAVQLSAENLPVLMGFKAPLTQTIHCLLDNAIKYSKKGVSPEINVSVKESEHEFTFSIKDNGIGIEPHFFEKIFIIFQRLHNREEYDGTGIGLSIAKKHVESWGGKIWLESVPEEGSTFYFTVNKRLE